MINPASLVTWRLPVAAILSAAAAIGCSTSTTPGGSHDCGDFGTVGSEPSCDELCQISNSELCGNDSVTPECSKLSPADAIDVCGVPLKAPPDKGGADLERSNNVDEYAGSGPPQLDCWSPGGFPAKPGTSQDVTMSGVAKVFSHGCESSDLEISVYTVKRGGADDGMPDQLVGSKVVTDSDCSVAGVGETNDDCGTRYECKYEYPGVPTETELMIVTDGALWAPIYEYNLYIANDAVSAGAYDKDVRALAQDDYGVIAQVAMGKNITPGNGAVAGEVHDCGDVRLINAVVDVDVPKYITTYFTDDEANPLPDLAAKATSTLALYSALDITPGTVTVGAAGVLDGKLVGVGFFHARVFADSVTSVTFRGMRPFQVP